MTPTKRAVLAVTVVGAGWALMVLGYDKPEWFFRASGIAGLILVSGAAIWWPVSARRAKSQQHEAPGAEASGN